MTIIKSWGSIGKVARTECMEKDRRILCSVVDHQKLRKKKFRMTVRVK